MVLVLFALSFLLLKGVHKKSICQLLFHLVTFICFRIYVFLFNLGKHKLIKLVVLPE